MHNHLAPSMQKGTYITEEVLPVPNAIVVPQGVSCTPLLIRAGYKDIANIITVPKLDALVDAFYKNPCTMTLERIGKRAQTADIAVYAVEHESPTYHKPILRFVAKKFFTPGLCMKACSINGLNLRYVPEEWRTYEMCEAAVLNNHNRFGDSVLEHVPKKILLSAQGECLCRVAVGKYGVEIRYVPPRYRTKELWGVARKSICDIVPQYPWLTDYIPKNLRSVELYTMLIQKNPRVYNCIPEHYQVRKDFIDMVASTQSNMLYNKPQICNTLEANDVQSIFYTPIALTVPNTHSIAIEETHLQPITDDDQVFYYISDIHIEHQIDLMGKTLSEAGQLIQEKVKELVASMQGRSGTILIAGDIADSSMVVNLFYQKLHIELQNAECHVRIISVLGNHELWDMDSPEPHDTIDGIIRKYNPYKNSFMISGDILLENSLFLMYRGRYPIVLNEDTMLVANDAELTAICNESTYAVLGGIGFSGLNPKYNANTGLYRNNVAAHEEMARTMRFQALYMKVLRCAEQRKVIILTHMPVSDWWDGGYNPNWVYVNGHTHRSALIRKKDGTTVLADNQVGYNPLPWQFKSFSMDCRGQFDPFKDLGDGIYSITAQQYYDFNSGQGIDVTWTGQIEPVYMIKRNGVYMFFQQKERLYMLAGGKPRKIDHDIQYYYENLPLYQQRVKAVFQPYESALETISKEVRAFGGNGYIHGCIVDIGYFSHIYLNPFDGGIIPYFAWDTTNKHMCRSVSELLQLEQHLIGAASGFLDNSTLIKQYDNTVEVGLVPILGSLETNVPATLATVPELVLDRSMYEPSRIMRSIQYLLDQNVVRIWKDEVLEHPITPQSSLPIVQTELPESL